MTAKIIECPAIPGFHILRAAIVHIRNSFRMDMTHDEAQANLDARAILINLNMTILDEAELLYQEGAE